MRGALGNVSLLDARINLRVFAVFVVVVFIRLVGVVRRVANDDTDLAGVLALDAGHIFFTDAAKQLGRGAPGRSVQTHVVQRVHKTQAGKFLVLASDGRIGGLNVQVGHVIRQDGNLIGVQLVFVLVRQLFRLAAKVLQQFANKSTRPRGGVQNIDAWVDQVFAEVLFTQPVGAVNHEAHDLIGRIDHAQAVSGLGVVDLVEVLVNDLQKGLLLTVAADLGSGGANGGVVGFQSLEGLLL